MIRLSIMKMILNTLKHPALLLVLSPLLYISGGTLLALKQYSFDSIPFLVLYCSVFLLNIEESSFQKWNTKESIQPIIALLSIVLLAALPGIYFWNVFGRRIALLWILTVSSNALLLSKHTLHFDNYYFYFPLIQALFKCVTLHFIAFYCMGKTIPLYFFQWGLPIVIFYIGIYHLITKQYSKLAPVTHNKTESFQWFSTIVQLICTFCPLIAYGIVFASYAHYTIAGLVCIALSISLYVYYHAIKKRTSTFMLRYYLLMYYGLFTLFTTIFYHAI